MLDNSFNTGYWSSLALDSWDRPHILYCDQDQKLLRYARFNGENWQFTDAAPIGSASACYASLALDSQDFAHGVYSHNQDKTLRYVSNRQGFWGSSTIHAGGEGAYYGDIAVDEAGSVYISYQDATDESLYCTH